MRSSPKAGCSATLRPVDRRTRTIQKLEEQKSLLADPNFQRTVKVKGGEQKLQKVLPAWRLQSNGQYAFTVKPIELAKGQTAVSIPSLDKLPEVIDVLISAVRSGELDQQLAAVAKKRWDPGRRRLPDNKETELTGGQLLAPFFFPERNAAKWRYNSTSFSS